MRRDKAIQFMRQAQFIAREFSKDPSTQVGALFLHPEDYSVLSQGYNGMPRGADESKPERHIRPLKYSFYEHAERNGIYNSARKMLRGSIAVTTAIPNTSCARALISVGVAEVYFPQPLQVTPDLQTALDLFSETGVRVFHTFAGDVQGVESAHAVKLGRYIRLAQQLPATLAKDPFASSTLFLSPQDYTLLTQGYSGFPRGADDLRMERYHGPLREMWVEGSVRNAIYNAARTVLKGSVGLVTATTCVECARGMASVGVSEVFYVEPSAELLSRWGNSFETALDMLAELKVQTTVLSFADLERT